MSSRWTIVGLAIVSDDDCIADSEGHMPAALRNDADWQRFQAELDRACLVVLGRRGHEAHGNPKGRRRMVVSSASSGLEHRPDAWWWNPAFTPWNEAVAQAAPQGGLVAVPGGQAVFDLFLTLGYDEFHLTRAHGVQVPRGRTLFSGLSASLSAEDVLRGRGLQPGQPDIIDPAGPVVATLWSGVRSGA